MILEVNNYRRRTSLCVAALAYAAVVLNFQAHVCLALPAPPSASGFDSDGYDFHHRRTVSTRTVSTRTAEAELARRIDDIVQDADAELHR